MKRFPLWHLAIVAVVCLAAFANSISGEFVWDDEVQIAKNPVIQDISNIPGAFTRPFWSFLSPEEPNRTNFYRPLQTVAYTIAYAIGGLSTEPYHAINIALHTLASFAVYLVCIELGFAPVLALLGAALFGAHPIHTEAISWVACTPDVACGFFYFSSLWAFLKSESASKQAWWISSAALLLPALLSKEMAITLPAVLLLLTYRQGAQPLTFAQRLRLLVPYGVVAVIYLAMRIYALGFLANNQTQADASLLDWITLGFRAFGEYIWLSVVPYPLIAYRMLPLHLGDRLGATLAGAGLILALAAVAWKFRKQFPDGGLLYAAFFVSLIPVFYFKGISNALMSDRYLYIPSFVTIVLVVTLLDRSKSSTWVWIAWTVVAVFLGGSIVRNQDWSTGERLYTKTIEQEPHVGIFHLSMANLLLQRGEDTRVLYHLNEAVKNLNDKAFAQIPYDSYNVNVARVAVLLRLGRIDEAIPLLDEAGKANPAGEWVAVYRGAIQMAKYSDDTGAAALLENAVKLNPNNEVAHDYLGTAYFNLGRYPEALAEFRKAVTLKPNFATAQQHLALMLQQYPQ